MSRNFNKIPTYNVLNHTLTLKHLGEITFKAQQRPPDEYEDYASRIIPPTYLGGPDALPEPTAAEVERTIDSFERFLGEKTLAHAAA